MSFHTFIEKKKKKLKIPSRRLNEWRKYTEKEEILSAYRKFQISKKRKDMIKREKRGKKEDKKPIYT